MDVPEHIAPLGTAASYVCGAAEHPLNFATAGQILHEALRQFGGREAAVFCGQNLRLTYADLFARTTDLATGLIALGLEPGDRIGIWSPNRLEWVLTQFATARAGLILVNINPAYRVAELEYALNLVGCKAIVLAEQHKSSNYPAMITELAPELSSAAPGTLSAARVPELRLVICMGRTVRAGMVRFNDVLSLGTLQHHHRLTALESTLNPDDPVNIQFTSGTTGSPKGATLTHFNVVNNAAVVGRAMKFSEDDRLCIPIPLYHCFGMVLGVLTCATTGATMVFPSEGFEPGETLAALDAERCTALHGVPTMFIAMLEHPRFRTTDFSSMRTGAMGGAPCPIEIMKRVCAEMNMAEITIAYGMTETSPTTFQSSTGDDVEKRVTTVGQALPYTEAKIIDQDGLIVPRGQAGELCIRGYCVMRGYWADSARTGETIDTGGWMHTGDLATIDENGYCNIVGRVKDMIIRGGENIYPREIEEFLFTHPAIEAVAVFGIPDVRYGESVAVWIKIRDDMAITEADVTEYCKGRIAHFKVPAHIRFVDEFPMTVTGKLQKFRMRQSLIEEMNLSDFETA